MNRIRRTKKLILAAMIGATVTISGCGLVYQADVQQGNYVTQKMVDSIELGMTKTQVEFFIGRPLVQDPFRNDRWDYFYSYRERLNSSRIERLLTLKFSGDRLVSIEGDIEGNENLATTPEAPELNKPNIDVDNLAWYEKIFK